MAPPGDDSVKLDVSEATEVRHKAVNSAQITHEQYELEVAGTQEQPCLLYLYNKNVLQLLAGVLAYSELWHIFVDRQFRQPHFFSVGVL